MSYLEKLFSIKGKIAIVTGSGRGNGHAIAEGLTLAGAKVVAIDTSFKKVNSFYRQYESDVCDQAAMKKIIDDLDDVDILVNNAGVSFGGENFENYPSDWWDKSYRVNLRAPFHMIQLTCTKMKSGSSIINITSLNSILAFPQNPAYVATKAGLSQLTKSAAYDLAKYGIRANSIAPGYIHTDMTDQSYNDPHAHEERKKRTILDRWGTCDDLVGASIFLASDASSYITGQELFVDGGWSVKGL